MAEMYAVPGQLLTDIADAIRTKRETTAPIAVEDFASEIVMIEGSAVDETLDSLVFCVRGAETREAAGYGIESGVHVVNLSDWTLFLGFQTDYATAFTSGAIKSLIHAMYEGTGYPGLSLDLYQEMAFPSGQTGRGSIGKEKITLFYGAPNAKYRRIAVKCSDGVVTVFTETHPEGYTFSAPLGLLPGTHDIVTFCIGQYKTLNGTYGRYAALYDVDVYVYENLKTDDECIEWVAMDD